MKMILLVAAFISFNVFADVTNFKCDFTEITYVNQFSLEGSVDHDNGEFVNAEFNFELRHAGKEPRIESMNIVRSGNVQVFEAGTMYRQKTVRISSAIKGAELEYVNILVDVPPLHSSHIRFADGTTFFGSCKSI
jgi:hypothetical protein